MRQIPRRRWSDNKKSRTQPIGHNGPFHVVKHSYNDVFTTYSVYINNKPFLKPLRGYKLGRFEAQRICLVLNSLPTQKWPEKPMTRDELLAVA
jgi:hypothetical protein